MSNYSEGYPRVGPIPHTGLDLALAEGDPVLAAADGEVIEKAGEEGFEVKVVSPWVCGAWIAIVHADDYLTYYCHLSKSVVRRGQRVKRGDIIGYIAYMQVDGRDNTHLHFEVRRHGRFGEPLDPKKFVVGCFGGENRGAAPTGTLVLTWPVKC